MAARRKSDRLHQLSGTLRRDRGHAPEREPVAPGRLRAAPSGLTPAQRAIWKREIRNAPDNVLFAIDGEVLRQWCCIVDRCAKLQKMIDAAHGEPGWEAGPAHRSLDRALGVMLRLGTELGFSPASRPRVRVEPPLVAGDDPWAELKLINGGRRPD